MSDQPKPGTKWGHYEADQDGWYRLRVKTTVPKPITSLVRRFRSAISGGWYESPHAAGTVNAVELDGQVLERKGDERTLDWIKRVAEWAAEIHANPSKIHCHRCGEALIRKEDAVVAPRARLYCGLCRDDMANGR